MYHYCLHTHHQEVWLEIGPGSFGYCYGCHRHHYWL